MAQYSIQFEIKNIIICTALKNKQQVSSNKVDETGGVNRLHFLAPVFGAGSSYQMHFE